MNRSARRYYGAPVAAAMGGVAPPPSTAMEAWFRKGVGITSAANAVSNWANQAVSGAARDLAQATGSDQPLLQGDSTILFDGASDYMKTAAFTLNQPTTIYIRVKQITWTASDYLFDGFTADTGLVYQNSVTPGLKAFAGTASAENSDLALGTWGNVIAVFNGASSSLRVNAGAAVTGNFGAGNMGGLTIGARGTGATSQANIQVAEVIAYSAAHDAATQAAINAYLNTL